jgi:hypothetical protein
MGLRNRAIWVRNPKSEYRSSSVSSVFGLLVWAGAGWIQNMTIASAWYTVANLSAAGVVVALLAAVSTAWVAYSAGFPKRQLLYAMPVVASMLNAPEGVRNNLELRHRGVLLTEPYVLEILLFSRGRKDIPSSAFDRDEPVRLDVGVRIVEVLKISSDQKSLAPPRVNVDGTSLSVGPDLIGKRQKIAFTLLTDGGQPVLTCQSSLVDVSVRQRNPDASRWSDIPVWARRPAVVVWWVIAVAGSLLFLPLGIVAAVIIIAARRRTAARQAPHR